jgi:hypothetical protein
MLPKWHAVLGFIFALFIYLIFPITLFEAGVIIFASIFIDFDHYMWYVKRYKDFNLKRAYYRIKEHQKHNKKTLMIFHTIEFLILTAIFGIFFNIFFFFFIGMLFHSILDFIDLTRTRLIKGREFSYINYLMSDKDDYL